MKIEKILVDPKQTVRELLPSVVPLFRENIIPGIIFSLKRGTKLNSNSRGVIFSLKRGKTLGRNSGGVIFSPKSPGLSQRAEVQNK